MQVGLAEQNVTKKRKNSKKEKRNQHTVNRAYLERFAGDDAHLYVFDKPTKKEFRRSARALTCEDYFYDVDDSSGQPIEDWFATTIEPRLMADLRHLDDAALRVRASTIGNTDRFLGRLWIPADIRASLAYAVILQDLRTTTARSDMLQAARTAIVGMGRLVAFAETRRDPGPLDVDFGEYYGAQNHAKLFLDSEWTDTARTVMDYPMAVLLSEPGWHFHTSDSPVILYNPFDECSGWLVPEVEIYFPISPSMALAFCNTARFSPCNDLLIRVNPEFVDFLNARQVLNSNRQVYSSVPNWEIVKSTLEIFPDLGRVNRPRTQVDVPDWFGDCKR